MFRNQYDQDVLSWSPQGRLYQVEYAIEAVAQGSTVVGCKGSECVILAALKRHSSSLAASHEKVFVVSPHVGLAVSGLVSDGHEILTSLRRSAVDTNFVFNRDAKVSELVETMSKSLQACTQHSSRRPYGAGVLLAGLDDNKAQLYQLLPTGEIHECQAVGIGSRSQASRTYLEKHLDELDGAHMEKVYFHTLRALREACPNGDLDVSCCTVGIATRDGFRCLDMEEVKTLLQSTAS